MTSRMLLEYDGGAYAGWARQMGQRSVQAEVEQALRTILREPGLSLVVAGRTDSGVHAWGQVCSYAHEAVDPLRLNALLPADIAVLDCNPAREGFDARRDAVTRTYCYRMLHRRARSVWWERRAWWYGWDLDRDVLKACAQGLVGTHDFTAFTPTATFHKRFRRTVREAQWREDGDLLEFWITADTFMRHMNRVLVGTMVQVATGRRSLEDFLGLLEGRPRAHAGATAPPYGLALASVAYG